MKPKDYQRIREELEACQRPLFIFHDDPDGLASYLLLYRIRREGKGILVKTTPKVDLQMIRRVREYEPDKIFVLDIAMMTQEFVDEARVPIIWIDHHEPQALRNVLYFNPRLEDISNNLPASYLCYNVAKNDLWIAMTGIIGDWYYPEYSKEFSEKYPQLLPADLKTAEDVLFRSRLGTLVMVFSFILKGNNSDVMKLISVVSKIEDPLEILDQTTPKGKLLFKKFEYVYEKYEKLLEAAEKRVSKDPMLVFTYHHEQVSFSKDLANELLYNHPDKIIVIGRENGDEVKISLRAKHMPVQPALKKALEGIDGYGGGHEFACGACIKSADFQRFLKNYRAEMGIVE